MVGHGDFRKAAEDFRRARQQVGLQGLLARWRGKSLDLLSFDDVRRQLRSYGQESRGLQEIPLDAIVGSVGRYQDFTRTFLPLLDDNQGRWARVLMAQTSVGLPPISVYQIGVAYFVLDGNHRVSVARQMGSDSIEAYVTEVKTLVPLSPDDEADDIILKAEYADFLARTRLDVNLPDVDLAFDTVIGSILPCHCTGQGVVVCGSHGRSPKPGRPDRQTRYRRRFRSRQSRGPG